MIWKEQWELFAPNFYEGKAHIDLSPFGTLLLAPGGGFGDLSHPTTRLMMTLMKDRVQDKHFLDIGCGSGILSLSALMMGAKSASGIDIEDDAIFHAKENAVLNNLKASFSKQLELNKLKQPLIIAMNMIFSEQKIAYDPTLDFLEIITSGILKEQRDVYLDWAHSQGWSPILERDEEGWLGFVFIQD